MLEDGVSYQSTVMHHRIRLRGDPRPRRLIEAKRRLVQVAQNNLQPSLLHPGLIPHASVRRKFPEALQRFVRVRRADEADDLLNAFSACK